MKHLVTAFLVMFLAANAGHARPWESATGQTFDVYMVRAVENEDDQFAIMGLFYEQSDETTLDDVVNLADQLFEEALINYAAGRDLRAAVVRFSPPGDVPEGELPDVIADVRYETADGEHWERVNYLDVPVSESPLFPGTPTESVTLSSGEELYLEPVTVMFPGDAEREGLNVRVVYPLFVVDESNGSRMMAMLWDEVVRPMATVREVNQVTVAIYGDARDGRFDYRAAYGGLFTKESWESWPTYAQMEEGSAE